MGNSHIPKIPKFPNLENSQIPKLGISQISGFGNLGILGIWEVPKFPNLENSQIPKLGISQISGFGNLGILGIWEFPKIPKFPNLRKYAACLYWLRATKTSILKARFDYCMAMAAICGLTAPEIVGKVSCSGAPSVAEHNPRYLELCKYLDLPTLKDLAIKSARRLLGQWLVYEPDLFEVVDGKIITVKASPGTLLSDLFDLSSLEMNDWYPEYRRDKVRRPCDRIATDELRPEWSVTWDRCSPACKDAFASKQLGTPLVSDVMNTFWLENRRKFKVLEKHDRTMKRLDISVSKPHKRSAPEAGRRSKRIAREPPELSSSKKRGATDEVRDAKRQCLTTFTCDTVQPVRRGRSSPNACWICGYRITGKKR